MTAMAALSGSSAITPSGLQLAQKPRNDSNPGIDFTKGPSDDDGSSATDADSNSSESEDSGDSEAESDLHNPIESTPNALATATGNGSNTEIATASMLASPRMETDRVQTVHPLTTPNVESPAAEQTSNVNDLATTELAGEPPASTAGNSGAAYRPLRSMPPPVPQYGRQLAPRGSALDSYRGKDGIPGYKPKLLQPDDGRVTATVPHKLRGKTDTSNGNFATIYMDLPTTTRQERMSAAQRSSEATVAAAAKANQATTERTARAGHPRSKRQSAPMDGAAPSQSQPRQVSAYYGFPARMPLPHETKMEQARLLSLFRSIHPASIVDQLCKGIGYFGGVPGAPPPPGGVFPLSESFNGAGALFISWLSEIFPPVYPAPSSSAPQQPSVPAQIAHNGTPSHLSSGQPEPERASNGPQIDRVVLPKRKRGRPKGSKSSKPRKDKGIKKGPNLNRAPAGSSVGVESQGAANGDPTTAGPSHSSDPAPSQPPQRLGDNLYLTPNGKRRGRPPGSKNKPKAAPLTEINKTIAQAAPARDDSDSPTLRHTLPNDSSPTSSHSVVHSQPDLFVATAEQPIFPSPPQPRTIVLPPQLSDSRKRRLSNSISGAASHNNDDQDSTQQALAPPTNSQEHTNSAPSQKRRRTSNSTASQDRAAEENRTNSSATSVVLVSPNVGLTDNADSPQHSGPESNSDGGVQMGQITGIKQLGNSQTGNGQSRNGQSRTQQASAQTQRWHQGAPGQTTSPSTAVQSPQRPAKQAVGAAAAAPAPSPTAARQPNAYSTTQIQQQRPPHSAPSWQRNMVGPQQAANPDAQPMAQLPRHGSEQQQRR